MCLPLDPRPSSSRDRPNQVVDILAVSAMRGGVQGYDTSPGYVRVNEVANWLKHSAYRRYGWEWGGWSPRTICFESFGTERSLADSRQISKGDDLVVIVDILSSIVRWGSCS